MSGSRGLSRLDFYAVDFPQQPMSKLLRCAALDFFRDHPITGLCRDYPAELKGSVAHMTEKSKLFTPYIPMPKGRGLTALFR